MAKTLVLSGTNFSNNKIETVSFGDSVPCTGISLNQSTLSFTTIGSTQTLVATPSPSDTTDNIIWASNDITVATVSYGIVTAVGLGTATITVSCGSYSATCFVTVSAYITGQNRYPNTYLSGTPSYSGGNGKIEIATTGTTRGAILASSGTLPIAGKLNGVTYYPVLLPANTKCIKITYSDTKIWVSTTFFCSQATPASGTSYAQLVDKVVRENISIVDNVSMINVPEHEGFPEVDSIVIMFVTRDSSEFLESYFNTITVEALPTAAS